MLAQAFTPRSAKIYSDQAKKTDSASDVVLFIICLSFTLSYCSDFKSCQFRDCHECGQYTSTAVSCLQQKSDTDNIEERIFFSHWEADINITVSLWKFLCSIFHSGYTKLNIILCLERGIL